MRKVIFIFITSIIYLQISESSQSFIPKYMSKGLSFYYTFRYFFFSSGFTSILTIFVFFNNYRLTILELNCLLGSSFSPCVGTCTALFDNKFYFDPGIGTLGISLLTKIFLSFLTGIFAVLLSTDWESSYFQLFRFRFGEGLAILDFFPALSLLSPLIDLCNLISLSASAFFWVIKSVNELFLWVSPSSSFF